MFSLTIATVIFNAKVAKTKSDLNDNLDRMITLTKRAVSNKADIICFPELSLTGYTTKQCGTDYSSDDLYQCQTIMQKISDKNLTTILYGFHDTEDSRDKPFVKQNVIRPNQTPQCYKKLHLAPPETAVYQMGNHIPVFKHGKMTFGIQLCYDAHFPQLTIEMALKGIDVLFLPHASPRGTSEEKYTSWLRHMPARAFDNAVYVLACNQVGNNGAGLEFPGIALSVDPNGRVISKLFSTDDDILYTELTSDEINKVRGHRMRYFLPNRRPELYSS